MKTKQEILESMIGTMVTMEVTEKGGSVWAGSYYGRLMAMPEARRYGLESGTSGRVYHLFTMSNVRRVGTGRIECSFPKPAAEKVKPAAAPAAAVPKMVARAVSVS